MLAISQSISLAGPSKSNVNSMTNPEAVTAPRSVSLATKVSPSFVTYHQTGLLFVVLIRDTIRHSPHRGNYYLFAPANRKRKTLETKGIQRKKKCMDRNFRMQPNRFRMHPACHFGLQP